MKSPTPSVSLFESTRIQGSICLNFLDRPLDEFSIYAHAFHTAGQQLAAGIATRNACADFEALPIVTLYRHALELYLKAVLIAGKRLLEFEGETLDLPDKLLGKHDLAPLLPAVRQIMSAIGWLEEEIDLPGLRSFADLEALVKQFDEIHSKAFAYPTDKDFQTALLPRHFRFNVLDLAGRLDPALVLLDGAAIGLEELLDFAVEEAFDTY